MKTDTRTVREWSDSNRISPRSLEVTNEEQEVRKTGRGQTAKRRFTNAAPFWAKTSDVIYHACKEIIPILMNTNLKKWPSSFWQLRNLHLVHEGFSSGRLLWVTPSCTSQMLSAACGPNLQWKCLSPNKSCNFYIFLKKYLLKVTI